MLNINTELATAYLAALQPLGVPVFYNFVTPDLVPSDYILFRSIQNIDNYRVNWHYLPFKM